MGQKTAPEGRDLRSGVKHMLSILEDLGSNSSITNKMNQFNFKNLPDKENINEN